MIWDELTSTQINNLDKNIPVVLPMAATEQHGAHLPVATDRLIGEHFTKSIHHQISDKILILPTISVGCSSHHMGFSGTLTISHDTFIRQTEEIIKSVIKHGFTNIILFNSHGGNQGVGQVLLEKLGFEHSNIKIILVTWWKLAFDKLLTLNDTGAGGVGHAGEFETSLMLLISPKLVNMNLANLGEHNKSFKWAEGDMLRSPKVSYFRTVKAMTSNGVYGDPRTANKEKGEKITEVVLKQFQKIVLELQLED